jgi:hypothetical protein
VAATYDDDGEITGLAFTVATDFGHRSFTLPVNTAAVQTVLWREGVQARYRTTEHANRVAWRILKDWIEAQLAIIQTEMVTLDQVMLPYMQAPNGQTVYELYVGQPMLEAGVPGD